MPRVSIPNAGIEFLVARRFPTLKARRAATINLNQTPSDLEETRLLIERANDYREELRQKSPSEIDAMVAEQRVAEREEARRRAEREERARFFHRPEAAADFDFWIKAAHWTLDEAVALSLGKNPRTVNWTAIQPYLGQSPFAAKFDQRRMLATRARDANQLADSNVPGFFLAWAIRNDIDVPADLVAAVEARGHQVADWKTAYDDAQTTIEALRTELDDLRQELAKGRQSEPAERAEKPLITRERDTVLKLIIGIAMGGYGYDPRAKRSPIASEIADELAGFGLSIDEDTVRKWLKEAKQILPSETFVGEDD